MIARQLESDFMHMIVYKLIHKKGLEGIQSVGVFQVIRDNRIPSYSYQMRTTEYCIDVYD